jgi:hypothetical protein
MHESMKYKILSGVNPKYRIINNDETVAKSSLASRKRL